MEGFDGDGTARFFYLSILGLAVLASVFGLYRNRLGAALQNLAIWGLIFAGLLVAYGYRDRIGLALVEGRPEMVAADTIVLRRGRDGHFHARILVNGAPIDFLVDTGATDIVLDPGDAERAGIDPAALRYTIEAHTANGIVRGARVTLDEMRFGDITDRNVRAVVNEVPLRSSLLGLAYLDRFSALRIEGDRMTLAR